MPYKYSPPEGTPPGLTRSNILEEFKRWNAQAGENIVTDWDLPLAKAGAIEAEVVYLLRGNRVTVRVGKWDSFATNLRCCYLIIRDMRLGEARGLTEAIREAYLGLPAPVQERDPYEVLGVLRDMDLEDIEAVYKSKAKRLHPDTATGEDNGAIRELNAAIQKIRDERKVPA